MALDVYNNSRTETLSARSWPSRSLTSTMSENLFQKFNKDGWDVNFVPFNPSASAFHYKDPMVYAQMKSIVGKLEKKKVAEQLNKALCFSIQIDGSADRQQIDSKFITARLVPSEEISIKSSFLGVATSDMGGADGLLDSLKTCFESMNISCENLVGLTTDGENANTGRHGGLWKLLRDHVGRNIVTVWCVCHRSDLAL